jgi:hypothetical protein
MLFSVKPRQTSRVRAKRGTQGWVGRPVAPGSLVKDRIGAAELGQGEQVMAGGHARAAVADDGLCIECPEIAITALEGVRGQEHPDSVFGGVRHGEVVREGGGACAWDVPGARIDGLVAALESLGGPRIEDNGGGVPTKPRHACLVDHGCSAWTECKAGGSRHDRSYRGKRIPANHIGIDSAVEHASAAVAEVAEEPPETRGDGPRRIIVADHDGILLDADAREHRGEGVCGRQGMPAGARAGWRGELAVEVDEYGPRNVTSGVFVLTPLSCEIPAHIHDLDARVASVLKEPVSIYER